MSVRNNARRGGVQVRAPTIFFSAFESSAANDGPLAGHQKLRNKIFDFDTKLSWLVKAGIGGFHTAGKQLAGKACNGVPV